MSRRSSDDRASSRAEARRRARLAARGELPEDESTTQEEPERERERESGGFLRRLFPPAPPLPNRPDPLAGFDGGGGALGPVRERWFLLRQNPVAWLVPGLIAFVSFYASQVGVGTPFELLGTFAMFGSLIAAGWFGWQRPTLYGTAAGLLAFFLASALILYSFATRGAGPDAFGGPAAIITRLFLDALYMSAFGFIGGWYGGYLRRRQTHLNRQNRRR